jgi:hypothetical protein
VEPKLPDHPLRGLKRLRRKLMPFPVAFPNPVGLDGLIESFCPPYYKDMDAAVDAVLAPTSGAGGMYRDVRFFDRTMKQSVVSKFLDAAPHHAEEAVECVRTVCRYIYGTYGRFPAHMNAVHSQSVWFQVHHIESDYYDTFFDSAYPETVESHQRLWHGEA